MNNSDLGDMLWSIILVLIIVIIVFLLIRELICWYYKINKIVELLEDQNDLLRKLLVKDSKIENPKELGNSVLNDSGLIQNEDQVSDEILMKKYNISFENGNYVYSGYKYVNLKDAINYAKLMEQKNK